MALDATFSLLKWPSPSDWPWRLEESTEWMQLVHSNRGSSWAACLDSSEWVTLKAQRIAAGHTAPGWTRRFGRKWLVFSPGAAEHLPSLVALLDRDGGNAYGILGHSGILLIEAPTLSQLTGGSYCETDLRQNGKELMVSKRVDLRLFRGLVDADLKLRREDEFFRTLPEKAKSLFASYAASVETAEYFEYRTEFAHGYTIAERVFQGTTTASSILATIESVFGELANSLYGVSHRAGNWSCQEPDALSRSVRRFDILSTSTDPIAAGWSELLAAERVSINERLYDGWPIVQRWLLTSRDVQRLLEVGHSELCHGDLILDDIVSLYDGSGERLVDPNGDSTSRIYDVGKMYLSTLSFYEALKYNFFTCTRTGCDIELEFSDLPAIDTIEQVGIELPERLRHAGLWSSSLREPDGGGLLLLNGLHNVALPMFHLLKHRAPSRALAFFAVGLIRLNQARDVIKSAASLRPEEAVQGHLLRTVLR